MAQLVLGLRLELSMSEVANNGEPKMRKQTRIKLFIKFFINISQYFFYFPLCSASFCLFRVKMQYKRIQNLFFFRSSAVTMIKLNNERWTPIKPMKMPLLFRIPFAFLYSLHFMTKQMMKSFSILLNFCFGKNKIRLTKSPMVKKKMKRTTLCTYVRTCSVYCKGFSFSFSFLFFGENKIPG